MWLALNREGVAAVATAEKLIPNWLANSRELQCVTPSFGGDGVNMAVTISGRPDRARSINPPVPDSS